MVWGLNSKELLDLQATDELCIRINKQMQKQGEKALHPYYMERKILKKYVYDNKQRFETTVTPRPLVRTLLRLGHDELGHNGSARTYALLRRNYYWKGMKAEVTRYVKQCMLCREHNSASMRYAKGTFEVPKHPWTLYPWT